MTDSAIMAVVAKWRAKLNGSWRTMPSGEVKILRACIADVLAARFAADELHADLDALLAEQCR